MAELLKLIQGTNLEEKTRTVVTTPSTYISRRDRKEKGKWFTEEETKTWTELYFYFPSKRGGGPLHCVAIDKTAHAAAAGRPIRVAEQYSQRAGYNNCILWIAGNTMYMTQDTRLTPTDVEALLHEKENCRRRKLEKAHARQAMGSNVVERSTKREHISVALKTQVWRRDEGKCVECGSRERLEFDHIIPVDMNGATTFRNLQLLCQDCNNKKGASLG